MNHAEIVNWLTDALIRRDEAEIAWGIDDIDELNHPNNRPTYWVTAKWKGETHEPG